MTWQRSKGHINMCLELRRFDGEEQKVQMKATLLTNCYKTDEFSCENDRCM